MEGIPTLHEGVDVTNLPRHTVLEIFRRALRWFAIAAVRPSFRSTTTQVRSLSVTATVAMGDLVKTLGSFIHKLSDENYTQSLPFYRIWFGIGQTYHQIPSDQIFHVVWDNRLTSSSTLDPGHGKLIQPTANLSVRFSSDSESGSTPALDSHELQNYLYTRSIREFFNNNLLAAWHKDHS